MALPLMFHRRRRRRMMMMMAPAGSLMLLLMMMMLVLLLASPEVWGLPLQLNIPQRGVECMYEQLKADELVSLSVFILAGSMLKATVEFDGPVAKLDEITSGGSLLEVLDLYDKGSRGSHGRSIRISEEVDYEHLNLGEPDDDDDDDDLYIHEEAPEGETADHRRERRARQRKKALEARARRDSHKVKQRKHVREKGEEFLKSIKAPTDGWYRFCVRATHYQVNVELDMRKESELGGVDEEGHVYTLERKALEEENAFLDGDTAEEEGVKDADFQSTRDKLKTLRRLLADIAERQNDERRRLIVHAKTNEHSHSRMVLSSLMETILFMAVTAFQVYTIRRWFKGAPVLGR